MSTSPDLYAIPEDGILDQRLLTDNDPTSSIDEGHYSRTRGDSFSSADTSSTGAETFRDRASSENSMEEKIKFNRKMSKVVEGLGSHAQGTIKVLQRYYDAASSCASPTTVDSDSDGKGPLSTHPLPQRKTPIYVSPYESLSNGEWLRKLAEIESARQTTDKQAIREPLHVMGCIVKAVERSGLRHLFLLSLLVVYLLLGGLTVYEIERKALTEDAESKRFNSSDPFVDSCLTFGFKPPRAREMWRFWDAVIYCFITITTIGYGDMTCSSRPCKIFTIFYLIFGIPLLLMTLSDMGRFMLRQLQRFLDCVLSRRARREGRKRSGEAVEIDLLPALSVVFIYIFLCSGIFCLLEPSWDFFTALYFVVISLSTIGFGDVVPSTHGDALAACIVLLIGLSIFSLVINVAQRRMELKYLGALKVMEVAYQTSLSSAAGRRGSSVLRRSRPSKKVPKGAVADAVGQNFTGFGRIV